MSTELTPEESMLKDSVAAFAGKALRERVRPFVEGHQFPTELFKEFVALGLMGTAYGSDWGGSEMGTRGAAIVTEELARVEPGFAAIYLCNSAPMTVLSRYGSDHLKREWLAPLCAGRLVASFGVSEPAGGSDVASVRTRAVEEGDHFVLNGAKVFSTNAGTPMHGASLVVAVTDPGLGPKGLSTFLVPVGTPGFSIGKASRKIGWRLADSVELYLHDCRLPRSLMVGQRGDGLRQILTTLSHGRVLVAAAALGLTRKCLQLAKDYGSQRVVGGAPIFQHQGVTFPLADIMTKAHAAELMIRNAACLADAGKPFRIESSMAKLFASELAGEAADRALQVHGGYGVFQEYEISGLLGEAKVLQIVEGTSEVQRLLIARELSA